ncbi:MAG: WcaF family extracellular polysaccharide biosynthesis acetyltransferase [Bacteroidales bacterium]|jgi:putative colanic acid biosynthesis acetyltransferase WcaF|nr:WcaF family extracellular polysaccharide biosynthesis acetyltransferase [Bacteroidales bacterium]
MAIDLSKYNNGWYHSGKSFVTCFLWYFVNAFFFRSPLNPSGSLKVLLLRSFGAKIGKGVNIKPSVNIKYPWRLTVGDYSWIGEKVWIDNLDNVIIGNNCCISQGAMLLCGNHNYKKAAFDLIIGKIVLENGVWIGAQSVVCPNVICKTHSILAVNSVATNDLEPYTIYQGNPAKAIRKRIIE